MNQADIDALIREREGYLRYGRADRAAQVADVLAAAGVQVAPEVEKRTVKKRTTTKK